MKFIGVELDEVRNKNGTAIISTEGGRVVVRVIHTDEESQIARSVLQLLDEERGQ